MADPIAVEIVVPRLGWSMEEGTFVEWLKEDGQEVNMGDMLFVLESEKAAQEVESFDSGILRIPPDAPAPGDTVRVGRLLGYLVADGQKAPFERLPEAGNRTEVKHETSPEPSPERPPSASSQGEPDSLPAASSLGVKITPRARRVASELGIDWSSIRGTGGGGRIREEDVRAAAGSTTQPTDPTEEESVAQAGRYIPITRIRRTISERMSAGVQKAAPCTLSRKFVASKLVALRERLKVEANGDVPSYTDIFTKLVALALKEHPMIAAQWHEKGIFLPNEIDIAFAVDTEAGLFAPVIRNPIEKSLSEIASESKALIRAARDGHLKEEQMQGGVFTVTNLGAHGIDAFTPIINLPQSAILGIGKIVREPIVEAEAIEICHTVSFSLTFDHRVIDGAPAARFLDCICQMVDTDEVIS